MRRDYREKNKKDIFTLLVRVLQKITSEVIHEIATIPLIFEVEIGAKRIVNSAISYTL